MDNETEKWLTEQAEENSKETEGEDKPLEKEDSKKPDSKPEEEEPFEGVETVEDIPEGEESKYGI